METAGVKPASERTSICAKFGGVCYIRATPRQRCCHINSAYKRDSEFKNWSGARDLNPGPHGPELYELPSRNGGNDRFQFESSNAASRCVQI